MYIQFCMYATTLENSEAVSKSSLTTNFFNIIIFGRAEFIPRQTFGSWYWEPQKYNRKKKEMAQRYRDHIWFWKEYFFVIKENAVK